MPSFDSYKLEIERLFDNVSATPDDYQKVLYEIMQDLNPDAQDCLNGHDLYRLLALLDQDQLTLCDRIVKLDQPELLHTLSWFLIQLLYTKINRRSILGLFSEQEHTLSPFMAYAIESDNHFLVYQIVVSDLLPDELSSQMSDKKEGLLEYILKFEDRHLLIALSKILDQQHPLGKIFWLQGENFTPSLDSGTLKIVDNRYKELSKTMDYRDVMATLTRDFLNNDYRASQIANLIEQLLHEKLSPEELYDILQLTDDTKSYSLGLCIARHYRTYKNAPSRSDETHSKILPGYISLLRRCMNAEVPVEDLISLLTQTDDNNYSFKTLILIQYPRMILHFIANVVHAGCSPESLIQFLKPETQSHQQVSIFNRSYSVPCDFVSHWLGHSGAPMYLEFLTSCLKNGLPPKVYISMLHDVNEHGRNVAMQVLSPDIRYQIHHTTILKWYGEELQTCLDKGISPAEIMSLLSQVDVNGDNLLSTLTSLEYKTHPERFMAKVFTLPIFLTLISTSLEKGLSPDSLMPIIGLNNSAGQKTWNKIQGSNLRIYLPTAIGNYKRLITAAHFSYLQTNELPKEQYLKLVDLQDDFLCLIMQEQDLTERVELLHAAKDPDTGLGKLFWTDKPSSGLSSFFYRKPSLEHGNLKKIVSELARIEGTVASSNAATADGLPPVARSAQSDTAYEL